MTAAVLPVSLAEQYERSSPKLRAAIVAQLHEDQQRELLTGLPWWWYGRPDQFAPPGEWRWWVINAGRGWGKTRTGAEWVMTQARRHPGCRIALVGATFADVRDTMVEGESGLLSVLSPTEVRAGSIEDGWNRSMGELYLANDTQMKAFSSEKPRALRGPQHHFGWGDEPSYWNDAHKGTAKDSTFSNLNIGLRLPAPVGWRHEHYRPRGALTMTPRLVPLLKVPDEVAAAEPHRAGLLQRTDVALTTGSTMANLRNLDRHYYAAVIVPLIGTTLGLQELGGQLLEDVEGALWSSAQLATMRDTLPDLSELNKTVVALDPAGGGGEGHDEHGIVVASSSGFRDELRLWVREDYSVNGDPDVAAQRTILAAHEFAADAIVYEKNQGQRWIPTVLRSTFDTMKAAGKLPKGWRLPQLIPVDAVKSKLQRATPIQSLYLQRRVRHVGRFPILEGQMTTWVPGETDSPDRLDALVWALVWLYGSGPGLGDVASAARREKGTRGTRNGRASSSRLPVTYGARSR